MSSGLASLPLARCYALALGRAGIAVTVAWAAPAWEAKAEQADARFPGLAVLRRPPEYTGARGLVPMPNQVHCQQGSRTVTAASSGLGRGESEFRPSRLYLYAHGPDVRAMVV